MTSNSLYCPCCERRIRHESNLYYHLMTKHHRSELSTAVIALLHARVERTRTEEPLAPK